MAKTVIDGRAVQVALRVGDLFGSVAYVLAIDLAHRLDRCFLLHTRGGAGRLRLIDEVIKAGELSQTILPAELVELPHTVRAIANDVARAHIDLSGRGIERRALQVFLCKWRVWKR